MAFSFATTGYNVTGKLRVIYGTYAQGNGDTGGAVATGLGEVRFFTATGITNVAGISHGTVTFETADPLKAVAGFWEAKGY